MNWRSETIEDLKTHRARESALYSISEKIEAIKHSKEAIKAVTCDKVPVQGGMSKAEDRLMDLICEETRLKETYVAVKVLVKRVNTALNTLTSEERKVLDYFYIHPVRRHIEKLMEELGYEQAHIYNIKNQALKKLVTSLYGLPEF